MIRAIVVSVALVSGCASPALKRIDYRTSGALLGFERHITVAPDGGIRSVAEINRNTNIAKYRRTEVREGRLRAPQVAELASLLADWAYIRSDTTVVPDGEDVTICYGGRSVWNGTDPRFWEAARDLVGWADALPMIQSTRGGDARVNGY